MHTSASINRRLATVAVSLAAAVSISVSAQIAGAAADTYDSVMGAKKLTICGVDGLLPYSSSDAKIPGFEVEIARKVGAGLGVEAEYTWVSWDALIPALTSKRCDAILDGMFITDERKKVIDFSSPYYASGETILVRKDNATVKGLEDLRGKKVGVLSGSVTVQLLESKGIANPVVYPDQNTIYWS